MQRRVLTTEGAGFIGSRLADQPLASGWRVRALDMLDPQERGVGAGRPEYLHRDVQPIVGDTRSQARVSGRPAVFADGLPRAIVAGGA